MNHFNKNSTRLAVQTGEIAFDKNRKRYKSRTAAKSYAPNKPKNYGLTFYAMVGSKYRYRYTIYDNGTGTKQMLQVVMDTLTCTKNQKHRFITCPTVIKYSIL